MGAVWTLESLIIIFKSNEFRQLVINAGVRVKSPPIVLSATSFKILP